MKLIIAGSRTLRPSIEFINGILNLVDFNTEITEVVSGTANGVDRSGEEWCTEMIKLCGDHNIKLKKFLLIGTLMEKLLVPFVIKKWQNMLTRCY